MAHSGTQALIHERMKADVIAIIDYGEGNLGSVEKALKHVGCEVQITSSPAALEQADGVVLPGVGAFDDCIKGLEKSGLVEPIKQIIAGGKPFLGICLGLQVLFAGSEEGEKAGLGVLTGRVVRFRHELKIPQIGWNQIAKVQDAPHLQDIESGSWVYFVHSYYVEPEDESIIATTTEYGIEFCSSVWRDNVFACQFHPEKSQAAGLKILDNFRKLAVEISESDRYAG